MVNFNICPSIYWSDKLKIEYLQRQIIVHSIIYYVLNTSVITDKQFDQLSSQLLELYKNNPDGCKHSEYYYCMFDYDGNTGFDLYNRLIKHDKEYLIKLAQYIVKLFKRGS